MDTRGLRDTARAQHAAPMIELQIRTGKEGATKTLRSADANFDAKLDGNLHRDPARSKNTPTNCPEVTGTSKPGIIEACSGATSKSIVSVV